MLRVTLQGRALLADQTPARGSFRLEPDAELRDATTNALIVAAPVLVRLGDDGTFHREGLLANDDPEISPSGWTYLLTPKWYGADTEPYPVRLNSGGVDGAVIELADVAPAIPGPIVYDYALATTVQAIANRVADLEAADPVDLQAANDYTDEQVAAETEARVVAVTAEAEARDAAIVAEEAARTAEILARVAAETTRAIAVEATKADLVDGIIPKGQIPPDAFDRAYYVADIDTMLALDVGGQGAVAIVAEDDDGEPACFLLNGGDDPTDLANWHELPLDPTGAAAQVEITVRAYADALNAAEAAARVAADAAETAARVAAVSGETARAVAVEAGKVDLTDPRLTDQRTPPDGSVTLPKLAPAPAGTPAGDVLTVQADGTFGVAPPTDLSAAAAQAVANAAAAGGVLSAGNAPTLASNRVPDPQVKTSGGLVTSPSYSMQRITTGLPAGFAFGIQSTRQGSVSAVIAQPYAGSTSATDPLRIPVTPGETITAAIQVWCDQALAKARLDLVFYSAAGAVLSTSGGSNTNFAAGSTWEQRTRSGIVVPASAAYVVLQVVVNTQSGNTVVGAVARITGALLYSGTNAAPVYADGTSIGWAWSAGAHASVSKKVLLALGEYETPTGAQAKVDTHNADGVAHPSMVRSSSLPALATNELLNPRLTAATRWSKTSGVTFSPAGGATMVDADANGSEFVYPTADKVVTPGETIVGSAHFTLLAGTATWRVRLRWLDAAFATITNTDASGAVTGVETRHVLTGVAPAGAAYCRLIAYAETMTPASQVLVTKMMFNRGAAVDYTDGTVQGCQWNGTADDSTSTRYFLTAAQTTALLGLLGGTSNPVSTFTVTRSGSAIALSRAFASTKKLVQNLDLVGSNNGALNIVSTTLDGVTVHSNSDDVCPIRTQMGTIGANHGYSNVATFTNPDGKTAADLGSVWQDSAGRQYVLLGFSTDPTPLLVMGPDYATDGSGVVTSLNATPATDLTHVSGATHTGAIDHTTAVAASLIPSIGRVTTTVWADGRPLSADGVATCQEVVIRESYAILDYAAIYDTAKANVGQSYTAFLATIRAAVRVSNVYRWTASGCRVSTSLTEIQPTNLGQCGAVQSAIMSLAGATVTRYLPGVGVVSGFDWTAGVPMAAYATSVLITTANLTVPSRPPAVSLDVLDNGSPLIGFAMGYLPYGERGDELSTNANRLTHAPTKLWDLRNTKKNYPTFTTAEAAGWKHVQAESFRAYVDPTQIAAVLASKGDAASTWEALSTAADLR